jgi:amino acid transporter
MELPRQDRQPVRPQLGLWDAVSIIIGIVIGAAIFKSPQFIMNNVSGPSWGLAAWALGGVLSLIGALCYAELASTYPRSGGDYVYLSRAYGSWCGFLFGWAQLAVILTASIGTMAFVFGDYALTLWKPPGTVVSDEHAAVVKTLTKEQNDLLDKLREPAQKATPEQLEALNALSPEQRELLDQYRPRGTGVEPQELDLLRTLSPGQVAALQEVKQRDLARDLWTALLAAAAVVVLTVTNILGVVLGKWTQNLLSLLKVVGLGAIVYTGFKYGSHTDITAFTNPVSKEASFGLAMIFVLYAFGGWNDAAFVTAEVRNRRNIVRALLLGTAAITVIYLAVNVAYLLALGFDGMRQSWTVAADVGKLAFPDDPERGATAISVLVLVSALGAINGLVFTGSRVYSTLGAEHSVFALLGRWSPRLGSPVWALLIQAAISLAMIVGVGTAPGRYAIDWCMINLGLASMPWKQYFGGFDTLVSGTAPVFWGFFLLSGLSLFALRQQDRHIARPFSVPLFPLLPLIFCGMCFYMLYKAIAYAQYISLIGVIPLAVGLPLYRLSKRREPEADQPNGPQPFQRPMPETLLAREGDSH